MLYLGVRDCGVGSSGVRVFIITVQHAFWSEDHQTSVPIGVSMQRADFVVFADAVGVLPFCGFTHFFPGVLATHWWCMSLTGIIDYQCRIAPLSTFFRTRHCFFPVRDIT